ncbi:hypothetical protein FB440_11850 [Vibrio crassostreae]|nr:hypothetical protein EDB60_101138 [Vibrio crassostreae]TCW11004.1 hypothetical protein EDB49_101805 [Vibrio crassostreae]TQK40350.1 hypothetical protein FB441_0973 [Vibrio crassostreae]TWD33261.1 hypothetical protein FB440_11850 [Vibrio crassostreae]
MTTPYQKMIVDIHSIIHYHSEIFTTKMTNGCTVLWEKFFGNKV